jgi:hypothetical protein
MKTLFSFLLLSIMTYNFVGLFPMYSYFESSNKVEIEKRIKVAQANNDFTELNLDQQTYDKLVWVKKNEFRYNGHLYDFVNKKIDKQGNIILSVISDDKETDHIKRLKNQTPDFSSNNQSSKNNLKLAHMHFQLFSEIPNPFVLESSEFELISNIKAFKYLGNLFRFDKEIPSPPPQFS